MVLIASMLLMSCGGAATERSMAESDESAAEETAMDTTTAAETPISSEAVAESADGIAFSLGSRSISTGAALYTLLQQKQYYESVSSSYYSSEMTAEDWQEIQSDGNTLAQNLTRSVWDTLCDDLAAAGYADANGIVLTEQESSGAEQKAREEYAAIPETDRTLTGLQEPDWISQKQLEALYEKVKEQVSGSYQKEITDDEARTTAVLCLRSLTGWHGRSRGTSNAGRGGETNGGDLCPGGCGRGYRCCGERVRIQRDGGFSFRRSL